MRRSALGSDQGPNDEQQAAGAFPIGLYRAGLDPQDPTNVTFPFLRRMRRDHMVSMGLHFITMDSLSAPWWIDGDDARVQAYADKLIRPIYGELVQIIMRFLWSGYSPGARNFQAVRPNWTYFEDGVSKKVWDNGAVDAIIYKDLTPLQPEAAQVSYANGNFNGIQYDARYGVASSFIINGKATPSIDKLHSFWATHDKIGEDGSPYGFPRIAHCAPIFWMYRWIWDLVGRGFENSFDPGPLVRFPSEDAATLDGNGVREHPVDRALRIGSRRRSGSTIAFPSDTYRDYQDKPTSTYKWSIEYPEMRTDFSSVMEFIGYLEAAKLNALFMPEQSLKEGTGGSSSRNVAKEFGDQRSSSQNVLMGQVHKFIVDVFIRPVIAMVFPLYEGELELKTIGAGSAANDLLRQVFQLVGQQDFARFGIDMRRLAEANQFPMLDPSEQQKELDKREQAAAKIASASTTPEVKPTQGRRSLVTQSGFGETTYHQLGGHISLSQDGDFVAGLPRVDAFSDPTVVAHARELRGAIERLLRWSYNDFAMAISKRRDMLSDGDAEAAVRAWLPDLDKVETYAQQIRRALGKVHTRSTSQALRTSMSHAPLGDATDMLDVRTMDIVARAMQMAREEMCDVVLTALDDDQDAKEIAATVRSSSNMAASSAASLLARVDVQRVFNESLLVAGEAGDVKFVQVVDECHGDRHGKIVSLETARRYDIEQPRCTMTIRLLPRAPDDLIIRREMLEGDNGAMYDEDSETILVAPSVSQDDEAKFMIALADSAFR